MGSAMFARRSGPAQTSAAERLSLLENPGWGRVFSDHMVTLRYTDAKGWHDGRIEDRASLDIHPGSMALHYAPEIFEGLKAYGLPDGGATLFRPDANARRFAGSAERLAMAPLPQDLFIESVRELVRVDREWIPTAAGGVS